VVSYYDDRTELITRKQSRSCVTDVLLVCIYLEIYHSPKLLWSWTRSGLFLFCFHITF